MNGRREFQRWVVMGLLALLFVAGSVAVAHEGHEEENAPVTLSRLVEFAGRFHPVVVHFSVAFVLAALLAEALGVARGKSLFLDSARFLMVLAGLSVVATVPVGWAAAAFEDYSGAYVRVLWWHRWLGTSTGILVILTAILSEGWHRRAQQRAAAPWQIGYRAGLVVTSVTMAVTGHLGAMLTHGLDHFTW